MDQINDYCGILFERICEQFLRRQARAGRLPFIPHYLGKWWGNNPALKQQDDVDILGLNKDHTEGIFCECKFKNRVFQLEDLDNLRRSVSAFPHMKKAYFYLFSKNGFSQRVTEIASKEGIVLITPALLFTEPMT